MLLYHGVLGNIPHFRSCFSSNIPFSITDRFVPRFLATHLSVLCDIANRPDRCGHELTRKYTTQNRRCDFLKRFTTWQALGPWTFDAHADLWGIRWVFAYVLAVAEPPSPSFSIFRQSQTCPSPEPPSASVTVPSCALSPAFI